MQFISKLGKKFHFCQRILGLIKDNTPPNPLLIEGERLWGYFWVVFSLSFGEGRSEVNWFYVCQDILGLIQIPLLASSLKGDFLFTLSALMLYLRLRVGRLRLRSRLKCESARHKCVLVRGILCPFRHVSLMRGAV